MNGKTLNRPNTFEAAANTVLLNVTKNEERKE